MSSNPEGGDFYEKDWCKNTALGSTDISKYDNVIDGFGEDGNRYTSDFLIKYSVDPYTLTATQKASARNIANYTVMALWFTKQKDFNSVREWKAHRTDAENRLLELLEIDPAVTPTVAIASSYRTSPLDESD